MPNVSVGVDLVEIAAFAEQLALPGSTFERSFAQRELRLARRRAAETGQPVAHHLAARWAAKEAFIKAWSAFQVGEPPVLADVDMAEIVVDADAWNRPFITLEGEVARACGEHTLSVSMSHDGGYAMATVLFS